MTIVTTSTPTLVMLKALIKIYPKLVLRILDNNKFIIF